MMSMKKINFYNFLIVITWALSCAPDEFNEPLPIGIKCDASIPRGLTHINGVSFDHDLMLCMKIDMSSSNFKTLSQQSRFGGTSDLDILKSIVGWTLSGCSQPDEHLFTYFKANIEIDGIVIDQVGIRKKGFLGSVIGNGRKKPSLKIKIDKFIKDQSLGQTERLTLNNNNQDTTRLKTCLAYDIFTRANYPAPRCNLANIMLGDRALGVYSNVEPIKKRFLRRVFGNDTGHLYEGTMADFTEGHLAGAVNKQLGHWTAKTKETDQSGIPLLKVVDALKSDDSALITALEAHVNLNNFIKFWALETLIAHTDGYSAGANNFYVYFDPDDQGRASFIPWGTDAVLSKNAEQDQESRPGSFGAHVHGELARRLSRLPYTAQLFQEELHRLLDEVWDVRALNIKIDHFAEQVQSAEKSDNYEQLINTLKDWINQRHTHIEQALNEQMAIGANKNETCEEDIPVTMLDLVARFAFAW